MNPTTLAALADFPRLLEAHFAAVPDGYARWTPDDWAGIPSEHFSPLGQLCHVRDIEIDGYHVRLRRMLDEDRPLLVSVDGDALAIERRYDDADSSDVLAAIREARRETLDLVSRLTPEQLARTGEFDGYGALTVRGLVHYLCSHDQQHLAGMQWLLGKIDAARHAREAGRQ